jgi:D-alanyl-D-alanine carboxypeptidase (penicillin-binding protein 5/6)
MENTHFVNCTGLDDGENATQHKTSAYDIALMSAELLKNHPDIKKYTTIWMDTLRNGTFGLSNTNKLIRFYPGATGLKTGFTSNAGYCLSASAQRDGMELVAVVMGAKTTQDRFNACKSLLDYGFANYALIQPSLEQLPTIAVKLGTNSVVEAEPSGQSCLLIEKGQKNQVSTHIELEEQITAPISQGQRLGTLTIKAGEQVLAQIPMVAKEAVPRLTFGDLFMEMLRHITMAK